jgi:predicted PurR-regulated permease PerM/CheY-like chemotaxis protein
LFVALLLRVFGVPAAPSYSAWQRTLVVLGSLVLVVGSLKLAQPILIPLALAILFAFVFQPLVAFLQRHGFRRVPAVLVVVCLAFAILGGLIWFFILEMQSLLARWPAYRENIERKIGAIDPTGELHLLDRIRDTVQDVVNNQVANAIPTLVELLFTAIFVIVLVIFMLLKREDLRNRMLRLIGHDRRTLVTTKAVDEATHRISRYLLMQLLVNSVFGLLLGTGLFLIGLDYAFVWGFLAALLRFIPYVGTWVALVLPTVLSVAAYDGATPWIQPVEVAGIFLGLEIVTANVAEPLLFGMSAGISPVGLLVAAVFWTWLWGPIGLILSTPLTVCLFVLGRYVPHLQFFEILLGEEPALETRFSYYQRLLARDQDEATEVVDEYLKDHSLEVVADDVLVPALVLAKRDREHGELDDDDEQFILRAARELVSDLSTLESSLTRPVTDEEPQGHRIVLAGKPKVTVLGFPATDEIDELALKVFEQLLRPAGCEIEIASPKVLASEAVLLVEKAESSVILIAALPPGGHSQARYLCKRLRSRFPDLKILVGRWGFKDNLERTRERLQAAGADHVATTLFESRNQLVPLVQVLAYAPEDTETVPSV